MAGANSVASVDPASTTKSYTKPTVYIAPAASITQSGELLRLASARLFSFCPVIDLEIHGLAPCETI
jgi:hypothetical protein